jgi:hypothetical protein
LFYAGIGDGDLDHTVPQNFRQTICFRTEDGATIKRMNFLLGAVDVARVSENVGSSTATGQGGFEQRRLRPFGPAAERHNAAPLSGSSARTTPSRCSRPAATPTTMC